MAFITDNPIDLELRKMKALLEWLRQNQRTFTNTFRSLPAKDRAILLKKIDSEQKQIQHFIEKCKSADIFNSGTKFGLENLKQGIQSLKTQWLKTLRLLETSSPTTGGVHMAEKSTSETEKALGSYAEALKQLGHEVKKEHLDEFKQKLDSAYKNAKEKSGGKDLSIHIVSESGTIKVRMIPK